MMPLLNIALAFSISFWTYSEAKYLMSAHKDPELMYEINKFVAEMELYGCPPVEQFRKDLNGAQYVEHPDGIEDAMGICITDIFGFKYIEIDEALDPWYNKTTIAHETLHCLWGLDHNEDDEDSLMSSSPRRFESDDEILWGALKEAGCLK